jgi:Beta-lactamase class C and other penicillin binding proteins
MIPPQNAFAVTANSTYNTIDKYVEYQRKEYNVPGLSIGVVKGNKTVYMKGFGKADSTGRSVTPQTPFIIGSVSKSFTALAIVQLIDRGKINPDENVDQYLPWFKAYYNGEIQKITVRQLLHHTSGLNEFYVKSIRDNTTLDELVHNQLNNTKLITKPGTVSSYSNANYIILGEIIQELSGLSYQNYIKKNIFEPLQMKHSYLSKEEAVKNHLAAGNRKWFGFPLETKASNVSFFEYSLPEGYIISCTEDMTHYITALLNEGTYQKIAIASKEGIQSLFNTEVQEEFVPAGLGGTKSFYGFGWRIIYDKDQLSMIQHTGETAQYHANVVLKPQEHIGVIQLANFGGDMTPISIGVGVADIMIGKEPPQVSKIITIYNILLRIVAILIISLLIFSFIRLKKWKRQIYISKTKCLVNLIFMGIINIMLPLWIIIFLPWVVHTNWKSSMLIFPDIGWTSMISCIALLIIGVIKIILLIQLIVNNRKPSTP